MRNLQLPNLKNSILILTIGLLSSCAMSHPNRNYTPYAATVGSDTIQESLFTSDQQTISEEDIRRLLDGNIKLPDSARIAVYNFGTSSLSSFYSAYRYNEEFLKLKQSYMDTLSSKLNTSERVQKVILMPSMITSRNVTLTNLRESAVRLQADLLIIFSTKSDIYYKYKAFRKDQAKAYATIETVLLDIRTGVVPFSSIITKERLIQKEDKDLNITETQKRAANEAVIAALSESSKALVEFLNKR